MTIKPNSDGKPSPALTKFYILWASLLASQSMIIFVAQTAVTPTTGVDGGEAPLSAFAGQGVPLEIFGVIGVVLTIAAFVVPRLILRGSAPLGADKVQSAWIVRWALLESVTVVGFVASMLYRLPTVIYPFAAVSLVGFALTFPSEEKIRSGV